jgi:hypothetical protein
MNSHFFPIFVTSSSVGTSCLIDHRNTPLLKTVRTPKRTVHVRDTGLYRTLLNVDSTLADSSIFCDLGITQYKPINRDMTWNGFRSTEAYKLAIKKSFVHTIPRLGLDDRAIDKFDTRISEFHVRNPR